MENAIILTFTDITTKVPFLLAYTPDPQWHPTLTFIAIPIVEITIKGEVNPDTGMVMNLTDLKDCIKSSIMDVLDHKNLVRMILQGQLAYK